MKLKINEIEIMWKPYLSFFGFFNLFRIQISIMQLFVKVL